MRALLVVLLVVIDLASSARILAFFPFPAKSHHNVFRPVIESLASRGHQITYLTPLKLPSPVQNVEEITIPNTIEDVMAGAENEPYMSYFALALFYAKSGKAFGERIYHLKAVQDLIHSDRKFDLILFETLFLQEPGAALMHKFNAVGVDLMTMGDNSWYNEMAGLPNNAAYMPEMRTVFTPEMTFWERIENSYSTAITILLNYYYRADNQKLMDERFNYTGWERRPPLSKLMSDKALILTNSHFSTSYPTPKTPHMKEVGGLHIPNDKPLPKDLQTFMDDAENGVIYFSFGSNLKFSHLSNKDIPKILINVLGKLKQKVLFKGEFEEDTEVPANIKVSNWFPQHDLLRHKNMKLFITHGGYLSITEAVYHGVPLIGIPVFAEQPRNMKFASSQGYGVSLNLRNLTESSLSWAINEVLYNPRYKNVIVQKSSVFKDRPMRPLEEAVYWIEYVMRNKNALQPKSARIPGCILYNLDIIATLLISIWLFKLATCTSIRIVKCLCGKTKKIKKD